MPKNGWTWRQGNWNYWIWDAEKKWVDKEGGSGVGTDVHPWRIHVDEWQKPLQYCKVKKQIKLEKKKWTEPRWCETPSSILKYLKAGVSEGERKKRGQTLFLEIWSRLWPKSSQIGRNSRIYKPKKLSKF